MGQRELIYKPNQSEAVGCSHKAGKQNPDLPHFTLSHPPTPTLRGWNFLLMAQCKRPLSYGKLTLKMNRRDKWTQKVKNRKLCYNSAFWGKKRRKKAAGALFIYPCQRVRLLLKITHEHWSRTYKKKKIRIWWPCHRWYWPESLKVGCRTED